MMSHILYSQDGSARNDNGSPASVDSVAQEMAACGAGANVFRPADQFTLRADNSAGVADVIFKFPSFDTIVEAIQGTIGASFFSVVDFPNGAGTVAQQAGGNIFGAQALAKVTATWAIAIYKLQASNTMVTALSQLTVNGFYGNIKGVDRYDLTMNVDKSISASVTTLSVVKPFNFTSNFALSSNVTLGTILDLTFFVAGYRPYTDLLRK